MLPLLPACCPQAIVVPTTGKAHDAFTALTRPGPASSTVKVLAEAFAVSAAAAAVAVAGAIALNSYNPRVGQVIYVAVNEHPSEAPGACMSVVIYQASSQTLASSCFCCLCCVELGCKQNTAATMHHG